MAGRLGIEKGLVKYHCDLLRERGLADISGGNYLHGHTYWGLTPKGRKYAVDKKLI
jgi:hypothetical protein